MRTIAWEIASQIALRNFSEGVGAVSIYVILVKGDTCNQAHIFCRRLYCSSRGADVSVNDFSAFLDVRRCKNLDS